MPTRSRKNCHFFFFPTVRSSLLFVLDTKTVQSGHFVLTEKKKKRNPGFNSSAPNADRLDPQEQVGDPLSGYSVKLHNRLCQTFAVLEDGALAHNLQEQEIEQYYSTNVQKNQLVQNDIRLAKRMQDEEEEQQAQQSALLRQASRQIEEQDLEYARVVQEELQRGAEEVRRREQHDAEIAKRLQEEEEQWMRRNNRGHDSHVEGSATEPEMLPTHLEEQCSSTTIRGHCFTSHRSSEFHESPSPRRVCSRNNRTSWSNQGQTGPVRQMRDEFREASGEESEDSDTVFNQQLSLWSKRMYEGLSNAPPRWRASVYQPHMKNNRTIFSHSNFTDSFDYLEEETEDWDEDYRKSKYQDRERRHKREDDYHRSRNEEADDGLAGVGERRRSRSESVRMHDGSEHRSKVLARTWSHKDNPDKRVSFQDDDRSSYREQHKNSQVWEMLGHILRERGVPVKIGGSRAPLQIRPQSRDSQVLHGSEVSYGDFQPHQRAFQRSATVRHSFHGDIRERRRLSYRENSSRDHREAPDRCYENGEVSKICRGDSFISNIQRRSSRRRKELKHTNGDKRGEGMPDNCRVRRATSERGHRITEERFSSDEEEEGEQEVERRVELPRRRALLRSQSLRISKASTRHRSRPMAGGASLEPEPRKASLDLGELHQVLKDEELARKLQREEEKLLSRNSRPSSGNSYPDGDFRVAQVAQDEEIAHYMQKQEIKSKRRSRELEGPGSWREHRLMITHHDRQATRGRQVQRERLDSEGLPSPTEDCSPEDLPPSPIATTPKDTQIRNVAEELDPTFQARSHSVGSGVGQSGLVGGSPLGSPSSFHNFLEEPTFIPPTKRQAEKSDVKKQKPKKETCKQQ